MRDKPSMNGNISSAACICLNEFLSHGLRQLNSVISLFFSYFLLLIRSKEKNHKLGFSVCELA